MVIHGNGYHNNHRCFVLLNYSMTNMLVYPDGAEYALLGGLKRALIGDRVIAALVNNQKYVLPELEPEIVVDATQGVN